MGFSEGLIRVMPGWEISVWGGHTLNLGVFIPLMVFPTVLLVIWCYPFLEAWVTGDRGEHHIADRPRNAPVRTAFGVAWMGLYLILLAGGGNDLLATHFHLSINAITYAVRAGFFAVPVVLFVITKRWCLGLQRRDKEKVLHGRETGVIKRLQHGEFVEIHEPLPPGRLYTLTSHDQPHPTVLPPEVDENGVPRRAGLWTRTRVKLSRGFYGQGSQIAKPTAEEHAEVTSGHGHH
jgi:ubiquinol-cytochrome c reductase cytochrome b subunit